MILRRYQNTQPFKDTGKIVVEDLTIDIDKHEVTRGDVIFQLTLKEFELLKILAENRGKVLSRNFLLDEIWGYDYLAKHVLWMSTYVISEAKSKVIATISTLKPYVALATREVEIIMRKKINALVISLMIIGILATGLLAHALLQRDFLNSVENRLLSNAYLIRGFLLDDVHDIDDIRRVVARESDNFKARVTVIDSNGVVVVDSEANLHELDNHGNRPEVIMAVDGLVGVSQRYSKSINMDLYYVAIPYDLKSGGRYVIRLSVPLTEISTFNYHLFRTILLSAAFGLVVAMLLGVRFLKVIINPIQDMSRASKEIANGKFGRSIIYDSDDELGELAENFNKMSEELGNKIMEIKDQKH